VDDSTLAALEGALRTTPQNTPLRLVIARAQLERACADRALAVLEEADGAEARILRARALLEVRRGAEALIAYREGVAESPGLEDLALAARIEAEAAAGDVEAQGEGPSHALRLISGGRSKSPESEPALAVAPDLPRVTFADVGGLANVKEQIRRRIILPFLKPSLFERFKRRAGGGILLYGAPGCGKTLLARATAGECDARFFNVAISDILDMYIGESEAKLHAIFEKARASAPAVLFFDEIEALGGKRDARHDHAALRLVSQFLAEMDGFTQANASVLVLGATNLPWGVDPAFRRTGRFDRFLFVPPPDRAARKAILDIHLRDRPIDPKTDASSLASRTSGFSGADLLGLVDAAADAAIDDSLESGPEVPIAPRHFERALGEIKPTTLEWLTTARNHARYANEGGQYDDVLDFLTRHGKD